MVFQEGIVRAVDEKACFPAGPAKVLRVHSGCYDAIACARGSGDSGNTDHSQVLNTDCTGCTLNKNVQLGLGQTEMSPEPWPEEGFPFSYSYKDSAWVRAAGHGKWRA